MATVITWPAGSVDGEREARRLQQLYASVSTCLAGDELGRAPKGYSLLIVVGHRDEIQGVETLKALGACVKNLGIKLLVMANCNSADRASGGTLSDCNELWSPAQRLADDTGAEVAATTRELLFSEVGEGTAFKGDATHGIVPANPGGDALWKVAKPKDGVEQITEGIKNL
jgi:hypothetical protein